MSKKSPLLIYNIEGDVENCHDCPADKKKPAAYVVHYNMSPVSKDDKKEFKGEVVSKGMERFLCSSCFRMNWRDNPMRHPQRQSNFTFIPILEWKNLSYHYK